MNTTSSQILVASIRATRHEQGAALVVGLILLLILTLLAISGMNTATTELIMAGNEQYQTNAFQAAETGIERTIVSGVFNTLAPSLPTPPQTVGDGQYTAVVQPRGFGAIVVGNSIGEFGGQHFEIQSTGTSTRGATSVHTQGVALLVPADPQQPIL